MPAHKNDIRNLLAKYRKNCIGDPSGLAEAQRYITSMTDKASAEYKTRKASGFSSTTKPPRRKKGSSSPKKKTLWSEFYEYASPTNENVTGKSIRNHIRTLIEAEQHQQCCYCRRPLLNNAYAKPIEHILPHSIFVQHTFNILNLSISCVDCNSKKSDDVWTAHRERFWRTTRYPTARAFSDMYHPRLHRYDEHIKFFRVQSNTHCISIYTGLTPQGIKLCEKLLTHISKLEVFVSANSELKKHIQTLQDEQSQPGSAAGDAIEAFKKAFDKATKAILEDF